MGNLLGEPFKDYVNKQINVRQDVHGKANRSIPELQYLNSKNAWIKLASGTAFDEKRLELLNKNNNPLLIGVVPGLDLAIRNVLFNGLTGFGGTTKERAEAGAALYNRQQVRSGNSSGVLSTNDFLSQVGDINIKGSDASIFNFSQTQRAGIGTNGAYGVGGTSQHGFSPMPGIVDADIKDLNRGSIKKATINLKAHNKNQFDVIDALYLRLGYSVMLEWGVDKYLSDSGLQNMGTTLIDKKFWRYSNSSYTQILPEIESLREKYQGNYDGMFGVISNFSWTFEADGSYNIKLELMSQGDVIESLKANPPKVKKDEGPVDSISPYTQITQKIAETITVSNRTQFFELYPGLEKIITDWYNAQIARMPGRGNDANADKSTSFDLTSDSNFRRNKIRFFPDLKSEDYTNENLTNQSQGQELKQHWSKILANTIQTVADRALGEAEKEGGKYIWKINRPTGGEYKQQNIYTLISWDYYTVLNDAVNKEVEDLGYGAPLASTVNGISKFNRKQALNLLFLVKNITLEDLLDKTYAFYSFLNFAGGKEDPQFEPEGQTAAEADLREDEQAELEQEKELLAKRNLNRMNSYLFSVRNLWQGGGIGTPLASLSANFGSIKSYKEVMGKIINPINGAPTPIGFWNKFVGFPIYKKNEVSPIDFFQLQVTPLNKQHFIRFKVLLKYIQDSIIPKIETSLENQPMIKINFEDKTNICYTIDNVISLNPNKIIACSDSFYNGGDKSVGIFKGGEIFQQKNKEGFIYGDLMQLYVNFARIEEIFEDVDENNSISIFKVLKTLATDINSSLGNINNIEPIIDKETNTVKFIDQTPIPGLKSIADELGITFKPTTSSKLEIFGLNLKDNTSNFVRKAGITTEISKEYATIITIGATANGAIPGTEATAFSKWNIGIKDRFKKNIIDPEENEISLEKQNLAIKQRYADMITRKWFTLGMNLVAEKKWTINDDLVELNSTIAPDFYKFAQAETTKNNADDDGEIESSIGFLPFNLKLEIDGLSGIKIYNKVDVNTSFLPSNYGDTLSFIITGVNHKLSSNEWTTSLDTIATTATKSK